MGMMVIQDLFRLDLLFLGTKCSLAGEILNVGELAAAEQAFTQGWYELDGILTKAFQRADILTENIARGIGIGERSISTKAFQRTDILTKSVARGIGIGERTPNQK